MATIAHEDLVRLVQLCAEIAALHVKYLKLGFKLTDIAATFARIYYGQLTKLADQEVVRILGQERTKYSQQKSPLDKEGAVGIACLQMSNAFVNTVTAMIKKRTDAAS